MALVVVRSKVCPTATSVGKVWPPPHTRSCSTSSFRRSHVKKTKNKKRNKKNIYTYINVCTYTYTLAVVFMHILHAAIFVHVFVAVTFMHITNAFVFIHVIVAAIFMHITDAVVFIHISDALSFMHISNADIFMDADISMCI